MTAQGKITAAKLTPTARILVQRTDTDGQVGVALRKTGNDIVTATVTAVEPVKHGRTMGRKITTDAGVVTVSAAQTFMVAPAAPKPARVAKVAPAKGTAQAPASTPGKPARMSHKECGHPLTFAAREACRRTHRATATTTA